MSRAVVPDDVSRHLVSTVGVAHVALLAAQWPLRSFLELGALPGAVPCARLHVRHMMWEWRLDVMSQGTELVVSELVTNGVQASRAMRQAAIRLWLVSDGAQVGILVWDASPRPPVQIDTSDEAENGRGLLLVDAVSQRWGYFLDGTGGKVVWAITSPGVAGSEVDRHAPST